MKVFNTYSRQVEDFQPIEAGQVRMYTCGPTVYNYAHIGNFRAYMFEDILRRQLRAEGYAVKQVMNLTDVDDKTIRGSRAAGVSLQAFTARFKQAFFEDLKRLNIEPAELYPAATDHIPEMIVLIEKLLAAGHAYRSEDGSIYYRVKTFEGYGRLAHLDMGGLKAEARVSQDEYDKENVGDFALWKAWDDADGEVVWDSPWGRGRPGWHIECSAMSIKHLGESFDIHTGGIDNIFPHHENEIAQSEGATGCHPFVRYWMHCGYLVVDGSKMSKSLGNFHTLRDLFERGYTGRDVRYVLLSAHYRQALNFTFAALDGARSALARVDEFRGRLAETAGAAPVTGAGAAPAWVRAPLAAFRAAMNEDLNTPEALAALFALVADGNRALSQGGVSAGEAAAALQALRDMDRVLGVLEAPEPVPDAEALRLLDARTQARAARNWAEADRIRNALAASGWDVRDGPEGAKLKPRRA
ncbi:MAG: cysteine--tRNA ligase [Lentisphaerae bacterium]|nr:cysteine--tRNA ligase [Lentisphaerota bacterium]